MLSGKLVITASGWCLSRLAPLFVSHLKGSGIQIGSVLHKSLTLFGYFASNTNYKENYILSFSVPLTSLNINSFRENTLEIMFLDLYIHIYQEVLG